MTKLIDKLDHPGAREICAAHKNKPDALLEVLHGVQAADGYLSDAALRTVADALNISRAEIHGVASFYHDYHRKAPAKHIVRLCRAEACQAVGSEELAPKVEEMFNGNDDVAVTTVYCLGNCALGPAAMVDAELHARVTPEKLKEIVARLGDA
ncbi:MAG: formate dehydrogenase [Marinicaulis sp.]|nr:NAD(P)H-dependent oxidoreductase subunit E [Marinicaulis sp.]NNE42067.1 formate dehydrogenase [Marinicaulis sp.]